MNNAIDVQQLQKEFEGFALKELSFTVPQGYITGFIGPNGSGKTTTIRLLLDMLKPDAGTICVLGSDRRSEVPINLEIGVVMDSPFFCRTGTRTMWKRRFRCFIPVGSLPNMMRTSRNFGWTETKRLKSTPAA